MAEEPNEKWDCSVCTYKNNSEAFKCLVCDTRKGTSTRYLMCFSLYSFLQEQFYKNT